MNETNADEPRLDDLAPSQSRLQREPDFTGAKLNTFRQVALRHGLPGLALGLVCLAIPGMLDLLLAGLEKALAEPLRYLAFGVAILVACNAWAWFIDRQWSVDRLGWILYLGAVSAWEEWVFRLAIPFWVEAQGGPLMPAIIVSNLVFGLAHWFTLRWKWPWCLGAFLGGMALSRQMNLEFDLLWLIGIHWIATFINTPRLPGQARLRPE